MGFYREKCNLQNTVYRFKIELVVHLIQRFKLRYLKIKCVRSFLKSKILEIKNDFY